MKVLVTGANGMLGTDLVPALAAHGHAVVACGRDALDVTDPAACRAVIGRERPDVVVHCAAYTNVDGAEADEAAATRLNGDAARFVAQACHEAGAAMVYVSTDYVFDGQGTRPYPTDAIAAPLGAYGRSKWAGEQAVREVLPRHYVVRTAWLYGRGGKNFVDTMRRLGREKPSLAVVADQRGAPTWTVPLAEAIAALITSGRFGTYHAACQGETTWHAFTERIMALEGLATPVAAITTEQLGRPAPRPAYSVLDTRDLLAAGVPLLPPWEEALRGYLAGVPLPA